ncbi:MAG: ATP-binding protein [Bacteroidales bacterium]|jgi:AAA15 family ATPase/GTPase|nr:ATP-binding protein [Bacteroidales bacterium]
MNKHLIIKNFGPIRHVDLDLLDYNVLIGPQATGKSTIAKMLYFFLSLKEDLWDYIRHPGNEANKADFERKIRLKFAGFFGTAKVDPQFHAQFRYAYGKEIELIHRDGYVSAVYSRAMDSEMDRIFQEANKAFVELAFSGEILSIINGVFGEGTVVYIPAGRSILSTLPDSLQQQILGKASMTEPDRQLLDTPLINFIDRISDLKRIFDKTLDEVIAEKQATAPVYFQPDKPRLDKAKEVIERVLKGRYCYDKTGEKIDVGDASVKLSFASSGQQEALWILMQLFYLILNQTKAFVIIEEPEAHLFPEAQKYITELTSLTANINGNQLLVTTHSPYILTTLNNHIYAEQAGRWQRDRVSKTVDPLIWVDAQQVNACYVDGGTTRSIMDDELRLIKAEEIDGASQIINEEFSNLSETDELQG